MHRFVLALLAVIPTVLAKSRYTVTNSWPGGFAADLCITNRMDVRCGWTVGIDFNPKITMLDIPNVEKAEVINMSRRKVRYVVKSLIYNQELRRGQQLCLSFVARYGEHKMINIRKLVGRFLYRCAVPTSTGQSTTTITSSSNETETTPLTTEAVDPTKMTSSEADKITTVAMTTDEITTEEETTVVTATGADESTVTETTLVEATTDELVTTRK